MFRRAAEGLKAAHHAGREFYQWRFERLIPRERLRFDYLETPTEQGAVELERSLHEEYRTKYLDRPPLDGGQRPSMPLTLSRQGCAGTMGAEKGPTRG